nr:MAG TPA: hypothetical protein [Bacteriophage sp.]
MTTEYHYSSKSFLSLHFFSGFAHYRCCDDIQ